MSSWMRKTYEKFCAMNSHPPFFVQVWLARQSIVVSELVGSLLPLLKLGIVQENNLHSSQPIVVKLITIISLVDFSNNYLYDVSPPQFYVHFYPSEACQLCGPLQTLLELFWTGLK